MTLRDMPNVTGSPGSEAGPTHSGSPDGLMTDQSGPVPVPVSRFRARDSERVMPTNDTSGPLFTASSPSSDLQRSLENRLRARMDVNGSPEYALTWSTWDMPAGPPICRLRASARRTSGNGCGGWPTPTANDDNKSPEAHLAMKGRMGGGRKAITSLQVMAKTAGWPTSGGAAKLAGWSTPTSVDGRRGSLPPRLHDTGHPLDQQAAMAGWATPTARDMRSERGSAAMMERRQSRPAGKPLSKQVLGANATSFPASTEKRGALNPAFSRWLMGFPPEWDACAPTGTR